MSTPSNDLLSREIRSIINDAVKSDPSLAHFSLRDVKRVLKERLDLDDAVLQDKQTRAFINATTKAIVEQALFHAQNTAQDSSAPEPLSQPEHEDADQHEKEEDEEEPPADEVAASEEEEEEEESELDDEPPAPKKRKAPAEPKAAPRKQTPKKPSPSETPEPKALEDHDPSPPRQLSAASDVFHLDNDNGEDEEEGKPKSKPKPKQRAPPKPKESKSKGKSKDTTKQSPAEAEVARLKSFVLACGVRKRWQSYFRDHDANPPQGEEPDQAVLRKQARVLKDLLMELGMSGRLSMEKAKKIKAEREFQSELADIGVTSFGSGTAGMFQSPQLEAEGCRGRKRRAIATSDTSEDEKSPNPKQSRTESEPSAPGTPEVVRRRRAFRQSLISESDHED